MASVYIVYHSGYGHTELQAEAVHRGGASVADTRAEIRATGEATANLDELDQADAIIFGCPTYMGNMSASFQVTPPHAPVPGDIQTAEAYGKRIAELTQRWVKAISI